MLTGGAGGRAMARALRDTFGVDADAASVPVAGRTDPWILQQMTAPHGIAATADQTARFRARYITCLSEEIEKPGPRKGVMPGVRRLLDTLAARDDVFLALLTGNYSDGARIKLEYFDLWRYFACGAFGEDSADRNALLPHAVARVAACGGPAVAPRDIVVVGDTPHDIQVAATAGARSVAVATGGYGVQDLGAAGADVVLDDLSDEAAVLRALALPPGGRDDGG